MSEIKEYNILISKLKWASVLEDNTTMNQFIIVCNQWIMKMYGK